MEFRRGHKVARLRRAAATAAWGLAALIAGCGGGGGSSSAVGDTPIDTAGPGDVGNHFPMAVGDRWVYRKTSSDGTDALKADFIAETRTVQGLSAAVGRRQDIATGQIEDGDEYYAKTGHGVYSLSPDTSPASLTYGLSRVEVLRFPLQPGTQHVSVDQVDLDFGEDLDGDGRNERLGVRAQTNVEATEAVTVSAGTFPNVARVVTVLKETVTLSRNNQTLTGSITFTDWYAPGVGLVRNRQVSVFPNLTVTDELELVAFSVGGRLQPASAPTVTGVSPVDGATVTSSAWNGPVVLDLEGSALGNVARDAIAVRHADGTAVPGETVRVAGDRLEFRPSGTLPPDTYSVTLGSGVTDVLGRLLKAAPSTSFTLVAPDLTAPLMANFTAAFGGTAGMPDATLTLDFSEPLAPDSVTPGAFVLRSNNLGYAVQSATLTAAHQVTLRALIDPGQIYSVSTSAPLSDRAGNVASVTGPNFTTSGGFSSFYPARNYSPGGFPYSAQAGDIDGDGRTDLVVAVGPSMFDGSTTSALHIYPHQSSSPLDPHVTLPLTLAPSCLPKAMILADVTGDGRTDIVLGSVDCGVLIAERSASGTWSVTATVAMPSFSQLLVADVNGDGRPDLVGAANGEYALHIAYGKASGGFGPIVRTALPTPTDYPSPAYFTGLAAGDLDGDGRTDLVALPYTTESTQAIMLIKQRSDGTLATASFLPMPARNALASPAAVLVGDLNSDGRADVVVSGDANGAAPYLLLYLQGVDGTLASPVKLDTGLAPIGLALADMDGNGRPDLVVQHLGSYARLGLYLQTRQGLLRSEQLVESAPHWNTWRGAPVLGDFNGDGLLDFMSMDYGWFRMQYQRPADSATAAAFSAAAGTRAAALPHAATPLAGPRTRFGLRRTPVNGGSAR